MWPFLFEKINGTKVVFSSDVVPTKESVLIIANHRTEVDWMYLWDLALSKGSLGSIKKWEVDEPVMRQMLSTFKDPQNPLWLALFPEGTDFTQQKCQRSQKFAAEVGLPVLTNVLLPKRRGFCVCLEVLRNSTDADPAEVHIHIRRVPIKDISISNSEAANWLMNTFQLNDTLLSDFKTHGHFPDEGTEGELSALNCLVQDEKSASDKKNTFLKAFKA